MSLTTEQAQALITRFAPRVYLHREERYLPTSIEAFLATCQLVTATGTIVADPATLEALAAYPTPTNYLRLKDDSFRAGMPLQNGKCVAPLYAKVNEQADYTEIVYMFCFAFSGWQMFRAKLLRAKTGSYVTRDFEWRDLAGHEGDWEHITVRISRDQQRVLAVYYARHHYGDGRWVVPGDPDFHYPDVHLALNSHASYENQQIASGKSLLPDALIVTITGGQVRWIKTIDLTADEEPVLYSTTRRTAPVPWEPAQIVLLTDETQQPWLRFQGAWGKPVDNLANLYEPPSLYGVEKTLAADEALADLLNRLKEYQYEKGPDTPSQQAWWKQEKYPPPGSPAPNTGPSPISAVFGDVAGQAGAVGSFSQSACAGLADQLQLCAVTNDGRLWHTIRYTNSWQAFGDVQSQTGNGGSITAVACAAVNDNLQVCAVNSEGRLWHTLRTPNSWTSWGDVEGQAGDRGAFQQVSCAGIGGDLHLLGVNSDGRLWHTIRYAAGNWQAFGDVAGQTGDVGAFANVSCTAIGSDLHVCGVTRDGSLWHTIRYADSWQAFGDIESQAGERGGFANVSCTALNGELYVFGITSDGRLWRTVRHSGGDWAAFAEVQAQGMGSVNLRTIGCSVVAGAVHLTAVTNDGKLWHTIL